jgi:hypothetical protein
MRYRETQLPCVKGNECKEEEEKRKRKKIFSCFTPKKSAQRVGVLNSRLVSKSLPVSLFSCRLNFVLDVYQTEGLSIEMLFKSNLLSLSPCHLSVNIILGLLVPLKWLW